MKKLVFSVAIFSLSFAAQAETQLLSTKTNLLDESCVLYEAASLIKDPEIDFETRECPGLGGYQVMISGGDLRYPLLLVYNGKQIDVTKVGAFHQAYGEAQWFFTRADGTVNYKALVHKVDYQDMEVDKERTMLVVTKLDKENTCIVAKVTDDTTDMEAKARELVGNIDQLKCLAD